MPLFEQLVNETGIALRIHVSAVVAVVVDGVALGKVDLEHRSEALHDCLDARGAGTRPASPQWLHCLRRAISDTCTVGSQQIKVRRDNFHGQAVPIEGSVVQHHVFAGAHAIEDGARSRHGSHREIPRPEPFRRC